MKVLKKLICAAMAFALLVCLMACGGKTEVNPDKVNSVKITEGVQG